MRESGWTYNIELEEGIRSTYGWFLEHLNEIKKVEIER
jgi:GDP-L-fucose synthase